MAMDELEEYEFNKIKNKYNGLLSKLAKRDAEIEAIKCKNAEQKEAIDKLSAELGRLKRKETRAANK